MKFALQPRFHLTSYGKVSILHRSFILNLCSINGFGFVLVSNNYWGLSTLQELSTAIYDFFDDATLGITTFDTILLAPATSGPVSGLPHWNKRWHSAYTLFFPITACGSK
jgi:hypothetical protein